MNPENRKIRSVRFSKEEWKRISKFAFFGKAAFIRNAVKEKIERLEDEKESKKISSNDRQRKSTKV